MALQFDTRRDTAGWSVFDRWTGRTVILAGAAQSGLGWFEADELADRLNHRRLAGDRSILQ